MVIKYAITFRQMRVNSDGTHAIRMRVQLSRQGFFLITLPIKVKQWDAVTNTTKDKDAAALIAEWQQTATETMMRYELIEKRVPSLDELKAVLNDALGRTPLIVENGENTLAVFDRFMSECGKKNNWQPATYTKFRNIRRLLVSIGVGGIEDFDNDTAQRFTDMLVRDGYKNTTISKYIAFVRWFLRWAFNNNYYHGNVHAAFRPHFKGVNVESRTIIYLTKDEILQVESCDLTEDPALDAVRDVFIFCCFSGLRYSDVKNLKRSNISKNALSIVTKKTADALTIELNDRTRRILNKYKNIRLPHDAALPVISNVKYNIRLKELGLKAGLTSRVNVVQYQGNERIETTHPKWEVLTTHVARRSFVVMALQLGIPIEVVMRWTGHSNYATIKPYVAIVDELKQRNMEKFNSL